MSKKYYRMNNAEFTIYTENLINQSNSNKAVLKFDQTKVDELKADNDAHKADLLTRENLQDTLKAVNASVKTRRKKMNKTVSKLHNDAENNDNVSDSLLESCGFDARNGNSTSSGVTAPAELSVTGTSDGVNHLKFKRNGNKQGTLFYIDAKIGDSTGWVLVDAVTGTKFDHKNQTPGVKVQYRARAKRGDAESAPSNTAIVYP